LSSNEEILKVMYISKVEVYLPIMYWGVLQG